MKMNEIKFLKTASVDESLEYVFDKYGDEICMLCEEHVLGRSRNSQFFQCEGAYCESALDYLIESLEDIEEIKRQTNKKYYLLLM
jgi:hypothetical protein